jgi:hypothetical protein
MKLKEAIDKTNPFLDKVRNESLQAADFEEIGGIMNKIYSVFSSIRGVEYTGASKVIHLFCPNLVVMWDGYMRTKYSKYYRTSDGKSPSDFVAFQKLMQELSKNVKWNNRNKTLAKAIDEYNYVTITLPQLNKLKKARSK